VLQLKDESPEATVESLVGDGEDRD
jgi:hypothetical protein